MKITKLIIENFKCYYGKQEIEFNTDGKITLIYGLSGAGKTSFLHCISWILYGKNDFLNDYDNKVKNYPLYNLSAFNEAEIGDVFTVKGTLEFTHNNTNYMFIRNVDFKKNKTYGNPVANKYKLLISNNGNWTEYSDDVDSKINEIVPRALSKYFFFHGEKMDLLNSQDEDLKKAIFNLFGINKYEEASRDLGSKTSSHSVISKYYADLTKNLKETGTDDPSKIFKNMQNCQSIIDDADENIKKFEGKIKFFTERTQTLMNQISTIKSSTDFKTSIKNNQEHISELENGINDDKKRISKNLYSSVPYLLLKNITKNSVALLEEEVENINKSRQIYFTNLTKALLKEIQEKHCCICGREVDKNTEKYIQDTIDMMPPDSYTYQLNQFIQKTKIATKDAEVRYDDVENNIIQISTKRDKIRKLDMQIKELTEKLKDASDTETIARQYEAANSSLVEFKKAKESMAKKKLVYTNEFTTLESKYKKVLSLSTINNTLEEKIKILENIKFTIDRLKDKKIKQTKEILEQSIVEVYNIFSTRVEDFTTEKFLNEDFSLRKVARTGGQEAIDVYSYIIGMIKALHLSEDSSDSEFPIIIDAPFSHTDVIQATNVFETLPKIASQVIILSLEIDKFRNSIPDNVGYTYVITSNDEQTETYIKKCTISELYEIEKENANIARKKGE